MNQILIGVLLASLATALLAADPSYNLSGQVSISGSRLPATGAIIRASCGENPAEVNSYGSFHLGNLKPGDSCIITITYKNLDSTNINIPIHGFQTNANLLLRNWQGKWLITRE